MKILVLNYEYPPLGGGAAPVCRDLAAGMAVAGHKVTVVTMGFPGLPEHEIRDGVEIYRLKCLRKSKSACMPWEAYTYLLVANRFLDKHLAANTYDVCHTHFIFPVGPVAKRVKERYGIPYVITAHGSDVEGYNQKPYMKAMHRILRPAWRKIVKGAYAVVVPSEYLLKLLNREMKSKKYVRIPNGLDVEKYQSDPGKKEKSVLMMGRMQKTKNFQTVLNAVALIPSDLWGDWHVDILGDGPYRPDLEKLCGKLGVEKRVRFHGWIDNGSAEQIKYLNRASAYISASHFENCPMAVLEAVASGCYPLLSDIEGHRQFFGKDDLQEKYFFPADNSPILSEKLQELMYMKQIPQKISMDIQKYEKESICARYIHLLEKAVIS